MSSPTRTTSDAMSTPAADGTADGRALGAMWSLLKHAGAAFDVITMGRKLGVSGVMFKAGVVVGAGVGMLLAPLPGAELRRRILARVGFSTGESVETERATVSPEVRAEASAEEPVKTAPARRHTKKAETPAEHRAPRAKSARASSDAAKPVRGAAKRAKRTDRQSAPRSARRAKQI